MLTVGAAKEKRTPGRSAAHHDLVKCWRKNWPAYYDLVTNRINNSMVPPRVPAGMVAKMLLDAVERH